MSRAHAHCTTSAAAPADAAQMATLLPARHRWAVSGTPVGRGRVEDLFGLLLFLRHAPFASRALWRHALQRPVEARLPGAMDRLMQASVCACTVYIVLVESHCVTGLRNAPCG
jgi:SNF2-related domain